MSGNDNAAMIVAKDWRFNQYDLIKDVSLFHRRLPRPLLASVSWRPKGKQFVVSSMP